MPRSPSSYCLRPVLYTKWLKIKRFIYASSSSVYGGNEKIPFSENDSVDNPVSLYAATKKADELIAHSYYMTDKIKSCGLRFFTVYGPWGRPDMALFKFALKIIKNERNILSECKRSYQAQTSES